MKALPSKRIALGIWLLNLVLFVVAEALSVQNRIAGSISWSDISWFFLVAPLLFASIGSLILSRDLSHIIGWLLCIVGLLFEISFVTLEYGIYTNQTDPGALPFGRAIASISWTGGMAFFLMTTQLLIHFPDGRTLSPRWRIVAILGLVGSVCASISEWFQPGPFDPPMEDWTNPLGLNGAMGILDFLGTVGFGLVAVSGIGGAISLVMRFRRASGIQREQLKWLAASGVLFITSWLFFIVSDEFALTSEPVREGLVFVGIGSIPISAGVAILRYRLYDIDWIINRTLVYVPLTAILAGVYIALTGVFRALLVEGGGSDVTVAMSTIIVVAMLTPVKNYLQERVDRRFKDPHDPAKALHKLVDETRRTVEVLDLTQFIRRFLASSCEILGASGAALSLDHRFGLPPIEYGEWDGNAAVSLPISGSSGQAGHLAFGPQVSGRPYTAEEEEVLSQAADVIAYLVDLVANGDKGPVGARLAEM